MKKKKGILAIAGTVLVASIFGMIGEKIGEKTVETVMESSAEKEIQEYIDHMESYVPGEQTDSYYQSEFWGLRFDANDSWVMYTEDELEASTANVRDSAVSSGMASVEGEDVSQDLIDKMFDSMYAQTEMGTLYVEDGYYVGECAINVMGIYGLEDASEDELFEGIIQGLITQDPDMETGEYEIAGENYKMAKVQFSADGMDLVNYVFLRVKDGMMCSINCKYVAGYDYVLDEFVGQMSAY